jgi:CHAT domain-containing protein/Flp pilus assembly protein TadD
VRRSHFRISRQPESAIHTFAARVAIAACLGLLASISCAAQVASWADLNTRAGQLQDQGKYTEALAVAQEALRVAEANYGPEHAYTSASLNKLATIEVNLGKYAEAEPLYKRALAIAIKVVGPDHPGVGAMLNNLAALYDVQGRYAEAEPLYKRAQAIDEKALGPNSSHVATDLNNLALMYTNQGRYAEAEPLLKRAATIDEHSLGSADSGFATDLHNLAVLYEDEGRYPDAEKFYMQAIAIDEKALGPDHPSLADTLNGLAQLYSDQGRYGAAEPLMKRSLAIYEKAYGPVHPAVATNLNNLALLYNYQGRYAEAEPLLQQAIAIDEKTLGPDHPSVAETLITLADLYRLQRRYADAYPLLKRALTINVKALGPDNPRVSKTLNLLALTYKGANHDADAEIFLKRSLEIVTKALGPDNRDVGSTLNNLAGIYKDEGRYAEAEPLYKRAAAIAEKALGPDHPDVASNLLNLAALYEAQGRYADADPYLERGLALTQKRFEYGFAYMSEKDRLQFLSTVQALFPAYFSFSIARPDRDAHVAQKMYDLVLWEKGLVGTSVSALRAQVAASGDPAAIKLLDDLTAKKSESSQLATSHPQGWAEMQSKIDAEANELEQQLARRVSAVSEQKTLTRATWKDVQKGLKPDEAAVEFVRYQIYDSKNWTNTYNYAALVVTPQAAAPSLVVLGDAKNLESAPLANYRANVALTRGVAVEETPADQAASAAGTSAAYDAFWKPLEPALGNSKRVYVSPDGVLNQIPLGLLADDSGKLLLEKYDLRAVNSTKDVLRTQHAQQSKVAVLLGNPKFDLTEAQQRTAIATLGAAEKQNPQYASAASTTAPTSSAQRSRDVRGGPLNPLPGTQAEVDAVGALLKAAGWQVDSYTRERALEEVLDRVQRPRIVHVATHGFFLSDQQVARDPDAASARQVAGEDPMLRSGLFFAGADRAESGAAPAPGLEDGVLTAYEAAQLNLHGTELVVLSACETGLGKEQNGEGVFGLRRGLQEAGADAVLMSMWSVPDRETQELMTLFYRGWLGGLDKHEALRQAQLKERETVRQRYTKDLPFYWGAFVLVGR